MRTKWFLTGTLALLAALPLPALAQNTPTPAPTPVEATALPPAPTEEVPLAEPTPIAVGDEVTGELTEEAPNARYVFTAAEGEQVVITHVSEDFDSYLILSDAEGNTISTNDDGAGNLDSRITATLAEAGDYIITVDSYPHYAGSGVAVGAYTLSLTGIQIEVVEPGETVTGTLGNGTIEQQYIFRASPGSSVTITMISEDFDTYLYLYDSSGFEVDSDDDSAGNLDSRIGPITLNDSEYTITATSFSRSESASGTYTLRIDSVQLQTITFDEPVTAELNTGARQAYFTFEAGIGELIDVSVDGEIDTNLQLLDPSGYSLVQDEDGGAGVNPELTQYSLTSTGTYTLIIGTLFDDPGSFTVTVTRAERPSLNDGPVSVTFTSFQTRSYSFEAEANTSYTVTLEISNASAGAYTSPSVDVQQDGISIASVNASNADLVTFQFEAPEDGELVVNLSEYSYANTSVTISITNTGE